MWVISKVTLTCWFMPIGFQVIWHCLKYATLSKTCSIFTWILSNSDQMWKSMSLKGVSYHPAGFQVLGISWNRQSSDQLHVPSTHQCPISLSCLETCSLPAGVSVSSSFELAFIEGNVFLYSISMSYPLSLDFSWALSGKTICNISHYKR